MILLLAFITLSVSADLLAKEPISSGALGFQSGLGYSVDSVLYSAMVESKRAIDFNSNYAKAHNALWLASQEFGNYETITEMKLADATTQNNPKKGKKGNTYQAGEYEILIGGLLSLVGGVVSVGLGDSIAHSYGTCLNRHWLIGVPLAVTGSALGSTVGVYGIARLRGGTGSFGATFLGSLVGCAVG
jgi:hypothetical protein